MSNAHGTDTDQVRRTKARVRLLTYAGCTARLPRQFGELAHTCGFEHRIFTPHFRIADRIGIGHRRASTVIAKVIQTGPDAQRTAGCCARRR